MFSAISSFPESGLLFAQHWVRAVDILFTITLLNTLLVMDSSVIPQQFLQRLRFLSLAV